MFLAWVTWCFFSVTVIRKAPSETPYQGLCCYHGNKRTNIIKFDFQVKRSSWLSSHLKRVVKSSFVTDWCVKKLSLNTFLFKVYSLKPAFSNLKKYIKLNLYNSCRTFRIHNNKFLMPNRVIFMLKRNHQKLSNKWTKT